MTKNIQHGHVNSHFGNLFIFSRQIDRKQKDKLKKKKTKTKSILNLNNDGELIPVFLKSSSELFVVEVSNSFLIL